MSALFALAVYAQPSNLRTKKIAGSATVKLDSLSIVPGSVSIKNYDSIYYSLDAINGLLRWKKPAATDSVTVVYRVFPLRLNAVAQRYRFDSVQNNFVAAPAYKPNRGADQASLFNFGKLNYNGSFGRSLSFGNSQDAVFNSQLNLQLSGFIGDSIEMAAAITDNNIPIQPDGTTQQLNEFDRVLLQFKKRTWEVDLGDIDLRQNQSYFLKFYKRLQGLAYRQDYRAGKNISGTSLVSGAIAKGKFARNIFQGQEGNQGPYKLQGNNNEFYFILLAGTEKVFIDGEQMQRGEDQDYVINYNTAEVTFTPKRMITKDKRIQVEFEYADRNYLNSMLYASNETKFGKRLTVNISAYSNVDARNSPINQNLDNDQKQFLANIGDSIQNAFYPVASVDSFSTSAILYKKIWMEYPGGGDSIYVYSTNPDSARYNLNFIETGFNKGNYLPLYNAANGRVYQWVAPVNGVPQGSFEPAAFLVTPKKQQIVSVGASYLLNDKTTASAEFASSKYDINTFSQKDKGNDVGYAGKLNVQRTESWKTRQGKQMNLLANAGYEWVDKNYQTIERLRGVEFGRDWGLDYVPQHTSEKLPSFSLQLADDKLNSVLYQFTSYIRGDGYKGYRNTIQHNHDVKGWRFNNVFNLTNINTIADKGFYLRPTIDISKSLPAFKDYVIGATYALEHNQIKNRLADTVTPASFAFETISAYLKSNPAAANRWSFTYFTRSDKLPYGKTLARADRSHNYNFQTELLQNKHHQFRLNVTYRRLFIINDKISTQQADNSLLGRAEYYINEWNGFVTGNILYELGAGQEQRRDFSYIEVPAGRGEYAWNDYNKDGIPQLNEFETALFQDQAKYIRVYTPTYEYVKAGYTQFNYALALNPRALANSIKHKGWKNFITRFNLQSSLQTAKKEISGGKPLFNPFQRSVADSALINLSFILSNTLAFNRSSSAWGADVTNVRNYNKALLTYGAETRQLNEWTLRGRVNIAKTCTIELLQRLGWNNLFTPSFGNRNYSLDIRSTEPKFTYINGTKYRVQTSYVFTRKNNLVAYGGEKATSNAFNLEGKYNAVQNTSFTAKFTFDNIRYTGETNSTVSYIMLDGLLPGKNFLWTFDLTKRLLNNLELTFEYEGRKPAEGRTIHIGRAGIRALL
ncbi:hypothetical protein [Foetidibacter luteolus]|uniref:hypothetical protein n=1 Tax=Foetidibacter luteolus TaxID=2608880 RepID=UPI001F1D13F9|nr:hypothetical protein [Foetidibacter luteolus]